jgi:hypothetical protein
MNFTIKQTKVEGRTYIQIEATPQSKETRALLREFQVGMRELEKKWREVAKANAQASKTAGAKRAR